ncbi:HD domain-containing protein [Candidatus Thorarchaeota archaeon]|nr:MAG: HD domain-containing protein [Candidatus Thorarchaeota archaeon]
MLPRKKHGDALEAGEAREPPLKDLDVDIVDLIRKTGIRENDIVGRSRDKLNKKVRRVIAEHERVLSFTEKHTRQKAIQDPVHGAILLEPWELDVISTWPMLRLRYVMQLGPAHIVYPGATHTRFQHCLGTNFLAQKCIRVVNYCEDLQEARFRPLSELLNDYQQKLFRAVAMLHDVGHPPTSHTIEFALQSWAGVSHVDLGEYLIRNSELTDTLIQNDIEPRDVIAVLKRRTKDPILRLLSDFVDSPLDIDKTDYLIRDAHFSGVQLGLFPAERVLLTNRVVRNTEGAYVRAFMLKALHSLEALILSRNWMFSDLYLHHAVRVAEALTSKATYFRIKELDLSRNEIVGLFTRMTDGDLYRWLEDAETSFVREYALRIRLRRLFKVILTRPLSSFEPSIRSRFIEMLHDIEMLTGAEEELGDDAGRVVLDVVDPELGEETLGKIPLLVGGENTGIDIVSIEDAEQGRPIMHALRQQKRILPTVRVYADPGIARQVRRRFDKVFPSAETGHVEDEYDMTDI